MKLFTDILQEKCGKWSIKRVFALVTLIDALVYETLGGFEWFTSKEYVFIGLLTFTATAIGLTVWANKGK
jgi:putative Mn2+ efflux pump MntP